MLPGMRSGPSIAIVGAGDLANALAMALSEAGYRIKEVIAKSNKASLRKAQSLARKVGARARMTTTAEVDSNLIWLCVPDGEIEGVARALATRAEWKGKTALHSSGALTGEAMDSLRGRGATVASVHPLMTFVRDSPAPLAGVPFAVEGDAGAVRVARRIVKDLKGFSYPIKRSQKPAYHAWGTFASPLFTAVLATAEQVAMAAGVPRGEARRRMIPILRQTLENYASLGAAGAFSGPIIRGDVETVKRHVRALRDAPVAGEVYAALARAAVRYLPGKRKAEMRRLLESSMIELGLAKLRKK
jgi:predicted short-subunit dehydrogenase-like oxidoreductase (DUF2520 family)